MDTGPVNALKDESKDPIHIDIGLYGYSPIPNFEPETALRNMEKFTREHAGYQVKRPRFSQVTSVFDLFEFGGVKYRARAA